MKFISIGALLILMGCAPQMTKVECNNIEGKHWTTTSTKDYVFKEPFSFCVDNTDTRWK